MTARLHWWKKKAVPVGREKRREEKRRFQYEQNHDIQKHLVRKSEHTKNTWFLAAAAAAETRRYVRRILQKAVDRYCGDGENPSVPSDPFLLSPDA
jgi:hypothetical protein